MTNQTVSKHAPDEKAIKPRLIRFRYFIWLLVPVAIYVMSENYGSPHMRWSYRYVDNAMASSDRYYTQCTYIGFSSVQTLTPSHGACPLFRLIEGSPS